MSSRKLYNIHLDQYLSQRDLEFIQSLSFDIAYQEYAFGVWETLSIWNKEGTDGNAISKEYHGAAKKNTIGEKLTNINKLIEDNFDCSLGFVA